MKTGIIIAIVFTFGVLLYSAFKAYIKENLGKDKNLNKEKNGYILGSVVYQSITTVLSLICVFNFL